MGYYRSVKSTFYDAVVPLVRDKTVLDVGSIGHSYSGRDGYKTWNFAVLAEHAAKIKGFDLLAEDIETARRDGFDLEVGDAETYVTAEATSSSTYPILAVFWPVVTRTLPVVAGLYSLLQILTPSPSWRA
jgi:hypothetical protein